MSQDEARLKATDKEYGINLILDTEYVGRPVERISEMMIALEEAWRKFPDMRLGQLMCVLVPENKMFNIEDGELLESIRNYLNM